MLPNLDLRLLRYFVAVAEQASFSAAADGLGVTQPALSQGIQRLEDLVGLPLFQRAPRGSPRGLTLTDAGASLLEDGRELLLQAERVLKRASEARARTRLRVGFGSSTPPQLLCELLEASQSQWDIDVSLEFVNWGEEAACLERGATDMVFLQAPSHRLDPKLEGIALAAVERLAIFPADHPLAGHPAVTLPDLDGVPIVDAGSDRDYWIVNPRPTGVVPVTVGPAARTVDEMLAFVAAGRGMAITSATIAAKLAWPNLRFVPILDLAPAVVSLVILRTERRTAVRRFLRAFGERASDRWEATGGQVAPVPSAEHQKLSAA